MLDHEKVEQRDIFEYGIQYVVDGTDYIRIDAILSNIISHEKDHCARLLMIIKKEPALQIQMGAHPRTMAGVLNSYTDLRLKDDKVYQKELGEWEDEIKSFRQDLIK